MEMTAKSLKKRFKEFPIKDYGVVIGFILLCIIISFATPAFFTGKNILNLLRQSSIIGIIATGMTFVILSGNFDLSVGAVAAFSGAVALTLMGQGHGLFFSIAAALATGCLVGFLNGVLVAKVNIPSLIATMGMVTIVRGVLLLFTGGYPISGFYDNFDFIGNGYLLGLPVPVLIFFGGIAVSYFILNKTQPGRYIYSVGGNAEASRLSGISVDRYKIGVFVINGLLAALAGIVLAARLSTATPVAGDGYDLDAIAAVVIGGTSVAGGEGNVLRTIIGVLFMSVISNSFNLLGVNIYYQYIFKGLIILAAVGFDCYSKKKAR